jgi:hypothetical protein
MRLRHSHSPFRGMLRNLEASLIFSARCGLWHSGISVLRFEFGLQIDFQRRCASSGRQMNLVVRKCSALAFQNVNEPYHFNFPSCGLMALPPSPPTLRGYSRKALVRSAVPMGRTAAEFLFNVRISHRAVQVRRPSSARPRHGTIMRHDRAGNDSPISPRAQAIRVLRRLPSKAPWASKEAGSATSLWALRQPIHEARHVARTAESRTSTLSKQTKR